MKRTGIAISSLTFVWLMTCCAFGERGLPASEGIINFGKVNATLYRGAQPDESGIKHLKALGIKTILNLRLPTDVLKTEELEARSNGIAYINVPLAGISRPTDAAVAKILGLIATSPGPVFVHCQHGCDRTGTIIACYRIRHDHWSGEAALREAEKYGISIWEPGMRRYIADFAKSSGKQTAQP